MLWFLTSSHKLRNSNVNLLESVFLLSVVCMRVILWCVFDARAKSIQVKIGGLRGAGICVRAHPLFMPAIRVKTREWLMRSNEAFDPPPLWAIHLICRRSSINSPCRSFACTPSRHALARTIPLSLSQCAL
jgi:uncharacterized membrane protein YagU involved in acid resistance